MISRPLPLGTIFKINFKKSPFDPHSIDGSAVKMSELIKEFTLLEAESIGPFRSGLRENRTWPSCVQTAASAPFNSTKFTLRNVGEKSKSLEGLTCSTYRSAESLSGLPAIRGRDC